MNRSRPARLLAVAALLGLGGIGILASAVPAAATAADTLTINGSPSLTTVNNASMQVAATAQPTCASGTRNRTVALTMTGPAGPSSASRTLKTENVACGSAETFHVDLPAPRLNGAFTLTLRNGRPKHRTTSDLDVLIPPAQTDDVAVSTSGTTATFTWKPNPEADLTTYELVNRQDRVVSAVVASAACADGSRCEAKVDMGRKVAGRTKVFAIRAVRCGLSCSGTDIVGPPSVSVAATFSSTPAPEPTPTPTATSPVTDPVGPPPVPVTGSTSAYTGPTDTQGNGNGNGHHSGGSGPTPRHTSRAGQSTTAPTETHHHKVTMTASGDEASSTGSSTFVRGIAAALIFLLIAAHVVAWASESQVEDY